MSKKVLLAIGGTLIILGVIAFASTSFKEPAPDIELESTATTTQSSSSTSDRTEEAVVALRKLLPKDDTAIEALVSSYHDLTMFYGSYDGNSLFKDEVSTFIDSYFYDGENWDDRVMWAQQVFKRAFVPPEAPAASYEMSWPNGPASGGEVMGKKSLDENTVLVYATHYWEGYMGPSAGLCKEGGISIDRFIFKKLDGQWWLWEVEENFDRWQTHNEGETEEECKGFNQDKLEKYKTDSF